MGLCAGVLTISNHRSIADDDVGAMLTERLRSAGHRLVERDLVADDAVAIRRQLTAWLADPEIDVVIATGGRSHVIKLLENAAPIVGFEALARWAVSEEMSLAANHVRCEAAHVNRKLLFALGGPPDAIRVIVERIVLPQIDVRPDAGNLVALLPAPRSRNVTLDPPSVAKGPRPESRPTRSGRSAICRRLHRMLRCRRRRLAGLVSSSRCSA